MILPPGERGRGSGGDRPLPGQPPPQFRVVRQQCPLDQRHQQQSDTALAHQRIFVDVIRSGVVRLTPVFCVRCLGAVSAAVTWPSWARGPVGDSDPRRRLQSERVRDIHTTHAHKTPRSRGGTYKTYEQCLDTTECLAPNVWASLCLYALVAYRPFSQEPREGGVGA